MADVDLTPTAEMARNAERGLELRRKHGRGGTEVGVARARDISNGKTLSPDTVRRMHAFFSRHAKNKAGGEDDAGYIAWMLWSGDAGRDWAKRKVEALDRKERNAMSETRKAIMERLGFASKSRFDDNCGTGAGGFKPGNKCGGEGGGSGGEGKPAPKAPAKLTGDMVAKVLGDAGIHEGKWDIDRGRIVVSDGPTFDKIETTLRAAYRDGVISSYPRIVENFSRRGSKARFEENCGTGAGGFKPGNTCGAEEGKGGGGAPEAKKRKRKAKPKRTPLAGPKVEKPAKIPSVQALEDTAVSNRPHERWDWEAAEDALSGRTDPQAKALRNEMSALVKRWDELTDVITEMEWGPSRKNRSATKRKATADELNLLQQRAKRIIRDAQKTEKTAKRSRVEQAGELIGQTIKAQDSIAFYEALEDVRSAIDEARKRGGAGSGKMRKSLKAMEEEWRGLQREVEGINADYTDMKDQQPVDERQARALKQRAGQLLQRTGDWRKRAQALVGQAKARASRTGDKRLMAAAVRAQKILARRPGPRTRFGFLDRIGRAATALTARPADTTAPAYASQVEEAKKAAISEVNNYRFLRDKVVARQQAMDAYVKQAAAAIAKSRVAPDIRHFTDQIATAVKAQQMMLYAVKTPFSRKGAKAKMAKWTVVMPSIPDAGTRHFDSWEQAKNYVDTKMGGFTALVSVDGKRYALKHALGQWEKFSRKGAKARAAKSRFDDNCGTGAGGFQPGNKCGGEGGSSAQSGKMSHDEAYVEYANLRETLSKLENRIARAPAHQRATLREQLAQGTGRMRELAGILRAGMAAPKARAAKPERKAKNCNVDAKPLAYGKGEGALEREDVKAGLKLMSASDPAVSDKIRTLIKEGKPQEQAVAIALDMKRRGEL